MPKTITLEDYQKHIGQSREEVLKHKQQYIVTHDGKAVFKVIPIIHEEDPKEVDGALWELKK